MESLTYLDTELFLHVVGVFDVLEAIIWPTDVIIDGLHRLRALGALQLRHETVDHLAKRVLPHRLVAALGGRHRSEGLRDTLLSRARIATVAVVVKLVAFTFRNQALLRPVLMMVSWLGFSRATRMYV